MVSSPHVKSLVNVHGANASGGEDDWFKITVSVMVLCHLLHGVSYCKSSVQDRDTFPSQLPRVI